jgi:hypothetical protein
MEITEYDNPKYFRMVNIGKYFYKSKITTKNFCPLLSSLKI